MGRASTPITILKNEGTSELFFELIDKELNPKDIKKALGLANSSISEQLKRLKDAKIINFKTDKKDKRNKYYYIDWKQFTKIICEYFQINSDLTHCVKCPIMKKEYKKTENDLLFNNLKQNKEFPNQIKEYFKGYWDKNISVNRISEVLEIFEEDLFRSSIKLNSDLTKWREILNIHYKIRKNLFEETFK